MIEWNGVLGEQELWGWPWHGRVERDAAFKYWLVKADGSRVDVTDKMPESLLTPLMQLGVSAGQAEPGTHLVKVPGHVMPARSAEQLASDAANGHEWCGAAMLSGYGNTLYGQRLGQQRFLHSNADGVWLVTVTVTSIPVVARTVSTTPLTLQLKARRFGVIGGADETDEIIGSFSAPSCLDVTHGITWEASNYYGGILLQAIRSDGGEVVLELPRYSLLPSRMPVSGAGYYKLALSRSPEGVWSCSLSVLAYASEIYKQSASGSIANQRNAVAYVIRQAPTPESPGVPYVIEAEVLADGGSPSGELYQPLTWHNYWVPSGTLEQQRTVHCGWVYDEADVLHRVEGRLRIVHSCNAPPILPSVSGQWTVTNGVHDNQIFVRASQAQQVSSEIVVEILLDGAVASSVSAVMSNSASVSWSRLGNEPQEYSWVETGSLSIAGEVIRFDRTVTTPPSSGLPGVSNWPDFNGVDQWLGRSGDTLTPWPGVNSDTRSISGLIPPAHQAITLGAARLSNNVWGPVIVCGRVAASTGGVNATWWRETTAGSVLIGSSLPATLLGSPVGPGGAGPGAGTYPLGTWRPTPIEYDYLHSSLVAGGGIF